ncbi:MAG: AMP-binding protein, partial [Armatimonadia bacterium]
MTARLPAAPQQFNIADICTRQHCEAGRGDKVAFRWLTGSLERTDYSFADLERESNRFANVLLGLGIGAGDICFTLLPKMPQQFFAFLGILKMQGVAGTLFANFGPEALLDRLGDSGAKCLITKKSLLKRVRPILSQLPSLTRIIVVDIPDHESETVLSYGRLMEAASSEFEAPLTTPDTPSVLHYTSGSTGKPKGVVHVHRSVLSQRATGAEVLGLGEDDVYWCTADQGWVTGTSYGIIAPWSLGVTQVHFAGGYDAEMWFRILEQERVNVWYSAPTALRMLMKEDPELFRGFDLASLRHIFSIGEPLNPEVIHWSRRVLDRDVYDTWFQTETGSIMVSNRPGLPIKPGSMGKPVTGIEAAVIDEGGAQAPVKA